MELLIKLQREAKLRSRGLWNLYVRDLAGIHTGDANRTTRLHGVHFDHFGIDGEMACEDLLSAPNQEESKRKQENTADQENTKQQLFFRGHQASDIETSSRTKEFSLCLNSSVLADATIFRLSRTAKRLATFLAPLKS